MRRFVFGAVSLGVMGLVALPWGGCFPGAANFDINLPDGSFEGGILGRGVGQPCDPTNVCRPGLTCTEGICQPGRSSDQGAPCVISAECKDGLYCGPERTCAPAGPGEQGAECGSDADCKSGLRCNLVGFGAQCQPEGKGDVGGMCATSGDCFGGLLCADKVCVPSPAGTVPPLGIPSFKGVQCEDEPGDVQAYFRVPRGQDDKDYFRLPYPNDIRLKNGRPDLTNFPTPGADLLGFDIVDRWARYLEQTGTGYSVYPTVVFRFSGEIDYASMQQPNSTKWVDVTPGTNIEVAHNWTGTSGRTQYVCANNFSFRPADGQPLQPGHTYAVLITNVTKTKDGKEIVVSPDLKAVLGAADPGGALSGAWNAYAPLRTWAAGKSFDLDTLINAAVVTVGKTDEIGKKLPAAVAAAPAPTATGWVKCGAAPSPCAQVDGNRACPASPNPAFDELHALVTLPLFQKGNLPFIEPADGGDFVLDGSGQPVPQGNVQACLALTVPKGTMPATGWPLVVYAHGTGGSFRSHINEGLAARLANIEGTTNVAVLGIDQVGHGTRRGASTLAPQNVFFNFPNPPAARGNVLQGAADQIALVRLAKGLTLAAGSSPTGAEIRFGKIAYWGHSQGATEGAIAMPYTSDVVGAVFSGVGGSLIDSLLSKKSPVNIAALGPVLLSELPANVNKSHPALSMFQNAIDPADPLDHAAAIIAAKESPLAKHVFVPYGQKDTYAPPATQFAYVVAAKLAVAQHPASVGAPDDLARPPVPVPVSGNAGGITAVVRQYAQPSGSDGHFVAFKDADAKVNVDRFLADALGGTVPSLGR